MRELEEREMTKCWRGLGGSRLIKKEKKVLENGCHLHVDKEGISQAREVLFTSGRRKIGL